ncbi:MAG: glutathione S-transferase [Alphaproteobacteria bacterium]
MKLIEDPHAPNPRRVNIFLAEKGIELERETLSVIKREHLTPAFHTLNPTDGLPVLVLDDGMAISETVAICRYFEQQQPEPPLMGATPMEQVLVEMWQRRIEFGLFMQCAFAFRHLHPAMAAVQKPQVAQWGEANKDRLAKTMAWLDTELEDREFIAGDTYTIADITALTATDFLKLARVVVPPELENFNRWHAQVAARPSAAA